MEVTQSFRLIGETDIIEILCDHIDGQYVVHWVDIQEVFRAVKHIKKGNMVVSLMKDSEYNKIVPHRIKHYPGVVLDVVLSDGIGESTSKRSSHSSTIFMNPEDALLSDDVVPVSTRQSPETLEDTRSLLSSKHAVKRAQEDGVLSEYELQLVSCLPANLQPEILASPNIRGTLIQTIKTLAPSNQPNEKFVTVLQDLEQAMIRNNELASKSNEMVSKHEEMMMKVFKLQEDLSTKQDEMKQLQAQAIDRLVLLQKSVNALLTQTFELHEYPIPRLFIVLPQVGSSRDPKHFFSDKFRLYFLCECECEESSSDKIHLAKHGGYDIAHTKDFFLKYGPYVLTILKMLKYGISAAGVAVPALSHLIADGLGQATESLKLLTKSIEPGVNYVIECIEKITAKKGDVIVGYAEQMGSSEALEGADLRQLEAFLKTKDENRVLGNLYRTVTAKGHVKWVCIDHYRKNYQEKAVQEFRDVLATLEGSFDESTGCVKVTLSSKIQADQFYLALEKARSVNTLCIVLNWKTTPSDFKRLRDTLSIAIFRPHDGFAQRSQRLSLKEGFTDLKRLEISLSNRCWDPVSLKGLVTKAPNLSSLVFSDSKTHLFLPVYIAIAGQQTCPITVDSFSMPIPPPKEVSNRSMTAHQCIAHLLEVNDGWIDNLEWSEQEETVVEAFVKATKDGSNLRGLTILSTDQLPSDNNIENITYIVACSELHRLQIALKEDVRRIRILESIQWEHLRELMITTDGGSLLTSVETLVNGRKKIPGTVPLEEFRLYHDSHDPLPEGLDESLQAFLASTSLIELRLEVDMTLHQLHSLVKSMDVSRLVFLSLRAKGFCSTEVDTILDGLQHGKLLIFTKKIPCDNVDGHSVVFWEDIEQVFPGVTHVMNGEVVVKLMRDSSRNRIVPHCIKHHPGVVLEVVLSSFDKQVLEFVQKTVVNSVTERGPAASLPSEVQAKVHTLSSIYDGIGQAIKDGQVERRNEEIGAVFGQLKDEMAKTNELSSNVLDLVSKMNELSGNKETFSELNELITHVLKQQAALHARQDALHAKQDEMKQLQIQALDRLVMLQNGVRALLTQTYELHEYPIPRLFIVLPDERSSSSKFRLYFLCECGEHTKSTNSKIPHHIHLAKHEGYNIERPQEFFQQYGSYVLTILQMLKYGLTVAGVSVPALTQLIRPDDVDKGKGLKSLTDTLEPG
ncbi:hypothetical protein BGX34_006493, partial [Mortierella sp. NVP85]